MAWIVEGVRLNALSWAQKQSVCCLSSLSKADVSKLKDEDRLTGYRCSLVQLVISASQGAVFTVIVEPDFFGELLKIS